MNKKIYEDISVCTLEAEEISDFERDSDFYVVYVKYDDQNTVRRLEENGFTFLNRTITASISLQNIKDALGDGIRAKLQSDSVIEESMYEIAYQAFPTDRRFHLSKGFDRVLAQKIIKGYLDDAQKKNILVFKCYHREKIVGFTVVEILSEERCENILGAVLPEYQKRGVAINLYAYMRKELAQKGYKELIGKIASSNISSLNLHISLGARFTDTEDMYCFDNRTDLRSLRITESERK